MIMTVRAIEICLCIHFTSVLTLFLRLQNLIWKKTLEVGDWTEYGFKIFIQSGVCEKGICYLGIKPLKGN